MMNMDELPSYAIVLLGFIGVLVLRYLGIKISDRLRKRRVRLSQARRHFVKAASMLAQAQSGKLSGSEAGSLAQSAVNEADLAIELDPKDAATLIVKSVALEVLRKPEASLKALDVALSKDCVKSLTNAERADTLTKRAELIIAVSGDRRSWRMQDALADLQESLNFKQSSPRVHYLLGTCCEKIGDKEDALVAFEQALVLDPKYSGAQEAVERLHQPVTET